MIFTVTLLLATTIGNIVDITCNEREYLDLLIFEFCVFTDRQVD